MSAPRPDPGRRYEVTVQGNRGALITARLRAAAHGGRIRLRRFRSWLNTPQGRQAALRTGRVVALAGVAFGGWVLLRRWADSARGALAAATAGYRRAAGAIGAAADGARFVLSLGWLSRLLRWTSTSRATGAHRHCPDCHARIRGDARVCYRCGCRELTPAASRRLGVLVTAWRLLALRLYHRCPDCRRPVHADARVCRACGFRLSG